MNQEQMINEIMKISVESYKQEKDRAALLLTKSDYLNKYITATFVFVNAFCAFLLTNSAVSKIAICIVYPLIGMFLCISLFLSTKAQVLLKGKFFPTGMDIWEGMKKEAEQGTEKNELSLRLDSIIYYNEYTKALEEANNSKAKILNWAYKTYLFGTIGLTIGFFIICLIVA